MVNKDEYNTERVGTKKTDYERNMQTGEDILHDVKFFT